MELSPFPFYGPLEPEQVEGRADLIADLTARLTARRVTALIGPRRYGKTSVLRKVMADLDEGGASVLWFDLYEVSSMADLAIRIDEGMKASGLVEATSPLGSALQAIADRISLDIGFVRVRLTGPAAQRPDPIGVVHGQLEAITSLAARLPLIVVFDEFSSIQGVDGAAGLLRTHLQHHYQEVGLVFAGSEPSMMMQLFTDQAQPFYAQAELIVIQPFTSTEVVSIVAGGFARTDRDPGPLPGLIAEFAAGHPQRTMQLADAAWRATSAGESATVETWEHTLAAVRRNVASGLERLYSSLSGGEKSVLRIVASGGSIFGVAAGLLDLSSGSARHARQRLLDQGHLHRASDAPSDGGRRDSERLVVTDPVFADWLRRTVPV